MKQTLLYAAFIAVSFSGWSQCSPMVYPEPAFAHITSDTTIANAEGGYWICAGLQVTINGSAGSAYYLEEDVTLLITATNGDQVFAKPGCSVTNSSDDDINITANFSTINVSNTGSGMSVQIQNCANLVYDYTLVGGSGGPCAVNTAAIDSQSLPAGACYPNPVTAGNNVFVSFPFEMSPEACIYDASGKLLHTVMINNHSISTEGMKPGTYFLQVSAQDGYSHRVRLIVL